MHKNFKNIEKIVYGRGSFGALESILSTKRNENRGFFLFMVDQYFKGKELESRVPAEQEDILQFIDVDPEEPTTRQVDQLRDEILRTRGLPAAVVGIGGGSVMDLAK